MKEVANVRQRRLYESLLALIDEETFFGNGKIAENIREYCAVYR